MNTPASFDKLVTILFPALTAFLTADKHLEWASRPKVQQLRSIRVARLQESLSSTARSTTRVDAMLITATDASTLQTELEASGAPKELLQIWPRYIAAVNRIINVYGTGSRPRYAADSISYDPSSHFWLRFLDSVLAAQLSGDAGKDTPPWDAFYFAVRLLCANNRDDALRYPELWTKDNAPAVALARTITWDDFPWAAVLVPGEGPERDGVKISPLAGLRMEFAVTQYLEKQTPFLIVSGGTVHPAYTEFNEAFEMKKWLLEQHGVPPERILLEPFARHTTTNFRNAGRILRMLGAPEEKPVLLVSNEYQLEFIDSDRFRRIEKEELLYGVGKIGPRQGNFGIMFLPSPFCGVVDPMDPMDP
ncbi:DUF218 domain-containing protein [Rhodocollybia butyracea]|uniref:DUF218 domain-containing protein n=1 Tax=Rhodocollybia butyracea TaxID=206335 RepID=A0A9P5P579_9AGAR|nr:DUF218 domain-containing protein [Rhodocollybia butyracea]